jgi:uncharacterized glyoxalase superfamily protein PhnB
VPNPAEHVWTVDEIISLRKNYMHVPIDSVSPMLKAKDLQETIGFYTNQLGFTLASSFGPDGKPTWCSLKREGACLMFYGMDAPKGPPSMTGVLYFYPKDVRALWEQLKDKVPVEWELQEMDYGMLEFAIRDCNGYTLSFGQDIDKAPPSPH